MFVGTTISAGPLRRQFYPTFASLIRKRSMSRISTSSSSHLFWDTTEPAPSQGIDPSYREKNILFQATLFPRCLAWISVNDTDVTLLEGYSAVCYTPPTLMFASSALPLDVLRILRLKRTCTLSAVTLHETPSMSTLQLAGGDATPPKSFRFADLSLKAVKPNADYPSAVKRSPIHMFCTLSQEVFFDEEGETSISSEVSSYSMILLTMETVVVDGSALSPPTSLMKDREDVTAKIDCDLIQPWLGLGQNTYSSLARPLRSMPRPKRQPDGSWHSSDLDLNPDEHDDQDPKAVFQSMEWAFRRDGRACSLGYNPVTAIIMPRPIGWISTYRYQTLEESTDGSCGESTKRIPHLAPYSFFSEVARGKQSDQPPLIAFSGYRRDGIEKKDAQQDAEDCRCFAYNLASEDFAVAMNYSAAELGRSESEFDLAGLAMESCKRIDAPMVQDAKIRYECEYVKTVDVGTFSIVVGKVLGVHIHSSLVNDGVIDPFKGKPLTRLGYMNEYGVLPSEQSTPN